MKNVIAENYLCFPALLEMIINDAFDMNISQFEIAEHFGIVVPCGYKKIINNQSESPTPLDFGTHIDVEKIQGFFEKNKIELKIDYYEINRVGDICFANFIREHLKHREYLMCSYSYGMLYGKEHANELGHVSLITEVNVNDEVLIYDPGPDDYGKKLVNELHLYDAIQYRHGGIYTFSIDS